MTAYACPICGLSPETLRIGDEYITDCTAGGHPSVMRWIESATGEDEFPMLAAASADESISDWNEYVNTYVLAHQEDAA